MLPVRIAPNSIFSTPKSKQPSIPSEDKTSHQVYKPFREEKNKISGGLTQCWNEFTALYKYDYEDYMFSDGQKFKYIQHFRTVNADRFCINWFDGVFEHYSEALKALEIDYNLVCRKNVNKLYLLNIHFYQYISLICAITDEIEKVYKEVSKLIPYAPPHCRSERHRIEYIEYAVIVFLEVRDPCSRANYGELNYK